MKLICYQMPLLVGEDGQPVDAEITLPYSDSNVARAKRHASEGHYYIEENGDAPAALSVEERLASLEKTVTVPSFVTGTWYYRGDKVTFGDQVYTCIAPQGVVCVWSPADYPQYWS